LAAAATADGGDGGGEGRRPPGLKGLEAFAVHTIAFLKMHCCVQIAQVVAVWCGWAQATLTCWWWHMCSVVLPAPMIVWLFVTA
jgi:hypothetical protein